MDIKAGLNVFHKSCHLTSQWLYKGSVTILIPHRRKLQLNGLKCLRLQVSRLYSQVQTQVVRPIEKGL